MKTSKRLVLPMATAVALLAAVGLMAGAESHTWDDADDFEGGHFESSVYDTERGGVALTGKRTYWKYEGNPLFTNGTSGEWDDGGVYGPAVVFAKGKYFLYYTGYDGSSDYAIGVATSTDGRTFSKHGSNPVLSKNPSAGQYDSSSVRDPFVLFEGGKFKMWYTGTNGNVESIAYAKSSDGLSWSKVGQVLTQPSSGWGSTDLGDPCVVRVGTEYYMYLSGTDSTLKEQVGMAKSSDGTSWSYHSSNPIIPLASSPDFGQYDLNDVSVVRDGPPFKMFFSGRDTAPPTGKAKIGYAWSNDGYSWKVQGSILINTGNRFDDSELDSPCAIWKDDTLMLYYHGVNTTGIDGIGLIEAKEWLEKAKPPANPMIGTGSTFDSVYLKDPCVIESLTNGVYHLYYSAYGSGGTYHHEIARASSSSLTSSWGGRSIVLELGSSTSWDDARVADPCVLTVNGYYWMYYSGYDGSKWGIGLAISSDGSSWQRYSGNPVLTNSTGTSISWENRSVMQPWVLRVGGTFHMYYIGQSVGGYQYIGHATSTDGLAWDKDAANPVLGPDLASSWETYYVNQPCVLHEHGRWTMYYTGSEAASSGWRIGAAHSQDGVAWTKDGQSPVMDLGNGTDWDDDGVSLGSVLVQGAKRYVYYAGNNSTNAQVGLAYFKAFNAHYTTPVLDATASWPVEWGTLEWDASVPTGSLLRFQVATNNGGSVWDFAGPDGTDTSYFETSGQNIFSYQSGRYLRVRVSLGSDDIERFVPVLRSVTVSYQQREAPAPPSVTVTSPNGGEDWMKTKAYPITWTATGNLNETAVSLDYSTDNGTTWTSIATRQTNTGHYKWTVPNSETSGALVRVTVIDIDGMKSQDTSDATFAIDPPAPKAGEFLFPREGDVLGAGPCRVEWVVHDPWGLAERPLTLELVDGTGSAQVLADGLALSDGYDWDVPVLERSPFEGRLRLSVLSWLGDISAIESGTFHIDQAAPTVDVDVGGLEFVVGEGTEVVATASDDREVRSLVLYVADEDGGSVRTYDMEPAGEGRWTASPVTEVDDARLWVRAWDGVNGATTPEHGFEVLAGRSDAAATSTLAIELVLAAALASVVVLVVMVMRRRGAEGQ